MSSEVGFPFDGALAVPSGIGLLLAALVCLILAIVAVRRHRRKTDRHDQHHPASPGPEQIGSDTEMGDARIEPDEDPLGTFEFDPDDIKLDGIPAFTSLPTPNEQDNSIAPTDPSSETERAGIVSGLLFRLLGTKARLCQLERTERSKSQVLESTRQALEQLKDSINDPASEIREEIDEMHELITAEVSASHQSFESIQELKAIIETQYDLLKQPGASYSEVHLSAAHSYIESIESSLDRRLKIAEKREIEFALGKERIMVLKKQMRKVTDEQADSAQMQ